MFLVKNQILIKEKECKWKERKMERKENVMKMERKENRKKEIEEER